MKNIVIIVLICLAIIAIIDIHGWRVQEYLEPLEVGDKLLIGKDTFEIINRYNNIIEIQNNEDIFTTKSVEFIYKSLNKKLN